jgi:hypothetical protein
MSICLADAKYPRAIAVSSMGMKADTAAGQEIARRIASLPETVESFLQPALIKKVLGRLLRLLAAKQPKARFRMPFRAGTSISNVMWKSLFFAEKNPFLTDRVTATIPLTQRRAGEKRPCALGFIHWLIRFEAAFHASFVRCSLALMSAIIRSFCALSPFRPFYEFLPKGVVAGHGLRAPGSGQEQRPDV